MNGTMPATVNSSEGSGETSEALGTTVWPRWAKCSRKRRRISEVCIRASTRSCGLSGLSAPGGLLGGAWGGRGGRVAASLRQLQLAAVGQRGVQAGAGAQLGLPLGGRGPDVGAELA